MSITAAFLCHQVTMFSSSHSATVFVSSYFRPVVFFIHDRYSATVNSSNKCGLKWHAVALDVFPCQAWWVGTRITQMLAPYCLSALSSVGHPAWVDVILWQWDVAWTFLSRCKNPAFESQQMQRAAAEEYEAMILLQACCNDFSLWVVECSLLWDDVFHALQW